MPFCDVDKDVSLRYITNTPRGDATDLDPHKQTIILLSPIFGEVTYWLKEQLQDPRLSQQYNLVAFDLRNMGLTKAPLSPERDTWVDAADLAIAHELLCLPPCHFFSVTMNSGNAIMKFAALFPDKCLSLCVCSAPVQAGEDPEWLQSGYYEFTDAYCFPQDLEMVERACMEFSFFAFNGQISTDLEDEAIAWWQTHIPPTRRTAWYAQGLCVLQRGRYSDEELKAITAPTIFLQGDKSPLSPPEKAQDLAEKMPDARVFVVNGGPQVLNFPPEYASVVNRVFCQFLSTVSPGPNRSRRPMEEDADPIGVCRAGLARLAKFAGDPSIAKRDATTPLSFTRLSPEQIADNVVQFAKFSQGESEQFSGLNEHGLPIRKFSERHVDEWKPNSLLGMERQMREEQEYASVVRTSSVTIYEDPH